MDRNNRLTLLCYDINTLNKKEGKIPSFYFHLKEVSTLADSDILFAGYTITRDVIFFGGLSHFDDKINAYNCEHLVRALELCKQLVRCSINIEEVLVEHHHRNQWITDACVEAMTQLPEKPSISDVIIKLERIVDEPATISSKEKTEFRDFFHTLSEILKEKLGKYYRPNCCINLGLRGPTQGEIEKMRLMSLGF